ncbi:MAG: hypothetical protein EOO28_24970 [Comamonadaceae bacterium]|nr:MAG: hypothetical protein EOO28_24970 [Comamonadaceae bacterium]
MRNISFNQTLLSKGLAVAGLVTLLTLGGCSGSGTLNFSDDQAAAGSGGGTGTGAGAGTGTGNGNGNGNGGTGDGTVTPVETSNLSSLARVGQNTGNSGSSLGGIIESVGNGLDALLPDAGMRLDATVGGVFVNTGQAVDALSDGVTAGLGQLGTAKDPVNLTLQGLGPAVYNLGEVVSAVGNPALIGQPLSLLQPVTTPVLSLVDQVGVGVSNLGTSIGTQVTSDGVRQVTGAASEAIVPLAAAVMSTTQEVGNATGVGTPVNNLLVQVGGGVYKLGEGISNASPGPAAPVGHIVSYTGSTVAALGGVVEFKQGDGLSGGLLAPVTSLVGGLGGGSAGGGLGGIGGGTGSSGLLAPVTNALGSLGGTGGTGGSSGTAGVLAPVTGVVGGVTGSLTGGTGSANNLLAPVTNLLGGLGGIGKK